MNNTALKSLNLSALMRARQSALPSEHGAWIFLFSPLAIGLALGGLRPASLALALTALAAFLVRQPVTMLVKVYSRRRPKAELPAALFWLTVYGLAVVLGAALLVALGSGFVLYLAALALPVLGWHLWLVSRRSERRKALVEIAASGALALAAPAALWAGKGAYDPTGWLLWALCWAQAGGTILHAYLRLEQRALKAAPARAQGLRMARPALVYNTLLLLAAAALSLTGLVPSWLFLAFLVQPLEPLWGALHPAVGVRPAVIGFRQLAASLLFTLLFILLGKGLA